MPWTIIPLCVLSSVLALTLGEYPSAIVLLGSALMFWHMRRIG